MSLSQLHKKQLEELEEFCGLFDAKQMEVTTKVESFFTQSTLSTLQAVWQMLEEGKKECPHHGRSPEDEDIGECYGYDEEYNQALTDTQKKIEEEIIKIKEMKI